MNNNDCVPIPTSMELLKRLEKLEARVSVLHNFVCDLQCSIAALELYFNRLNEKVK